MSHLQTDKRAKISSSEIPASNIIGIYEIVTADLMVASFWNRKIGEVAGYLTAKIFITTLSFLVTTPGIWKSSDGIIISDFFVVKDLAFLGFFAGIGTNRKGKNQQVEQ